MTSPQGVNYEMEDSLVRCPSSTSISAPQEQQCYVDEKHSRTLELSCSVLVSSLLGITIHKCRTDE